MLPENLLETNKFQIIFDEMEEGKELKSLVGKLPEVKIIEEDEEEEEYDDN